MAQESFREILEAFETVLRDAGLHRSLGFLNLRTSHRFTGIYRFDAQVLRNVMLFDRQNPDLSLGEDAPMKETYCSIVGANVAPFFTADARLEEQLAEHPARENIISYCGVVLSTDDGRTFGTLCHFDLLPQPIHIDEIPLMEAAAPLIMRALRDHKLAAAPGL